MRSGAARRIPFSYTFQVTFIEKSNRLFSNFLFVEHATHWHLRWFGAAVLLLALVYLVDLGRSFLSERRLSAVDLPFLLGGAILSSTSSEPDGWHLSGQVRFPRPDDGSYCRSAGCSCATTRAAAIRQWGLVALIGAAAAWLIPDMITGLPYRCRLWLWKFELQHPCRCRGRAAAGVVAGRQSWFRGRCNRGDGPPCSSRSRSTATARTPHPCIRSLTRPIQRNGERYEGEPQKGDITIAVKDLGYYMTGPSSTAKRRLSAATNASLG